MKRSTYILIFIAAFIALFLYNLLKQPSLTPNTAPNINTTLRTVIEFDGAKNLEDISKKLPGGTFAKSNIYLLYVHLCRRGNGFHAGPHIHTRRLFQC